jgi:hypothetical protein
MLPRILAAAVALLATAAPLAPAPAAEREYRQADLAVGGAWARPTAGAQTNGAAYTAIANGGDIADRLIAARSPVARAVELHNHTIDAEGVARMRQVAAVEIPARGEARLAPGGLHVMLVGLSEPLREGAGFPLTLVFERAGEVTVEVAVERSPPPAAAAVDTHGSRHTPPGGGGHPHHDGGATAHGDGHAAGHHAPAR